MILCPHIFRVDLQVILHCLDRKANSAKFDISDVLEANTTLGKFKITGSKEHLYELHFGDNSVMSLHHVHVQILRNGIFHASIFLQFFACFPCGDGINFLIITVMVLMSTDQDCINSYFDGGDMHDTSSSEQRMHDDDDNDGTLSHVDNIPKKVRHLIMHALLYYCGASLHIIGTKCDSCSYEFEDFFGRINI